LEPLLKGEERQDVMRNKNQDIQRSASFRRVITFGEPINTVTATPAAAGRAEIDRRGGSVDSFAEDVLLLLFARAPTTVPCPLEFFIRVNSVV
jgi:hypothetical protein